MPTYEYECTRCAARVELVQRVSDPPLKKCRQCGGPVRKLLFPVGVIYRGSGFYTTDYARKGSSVENGDGKKDKSPQPEKKDQPAADKS